MTVTPVRYGLTLVACALMGTAVFADRSAVAAAPYAGSVIAYSVKTGVYSVHADGTGLRLLVPWQPSSCGEGCVVWKVPRNPRYSPNGRQLTYDRRHTSYTMVSGRGRSRTRAPFTLPTQTASIGVLGWVTTPSSPQMARK